MDAEITARFGDLCDQLHAGELDSWRGGTLSSLAALIVGDQLTRNAHRDSAKMYMNDEKCLRWAKEMVADGSCGQLKPVQRCAALPAARCRAGSMPVTAAGG